MFALTSSALATACRRSLSTAAPALASLYNPTEEHELLRQTVRAFADSEVRPQALEHNREEKFNLELFRRLGSELGLLGITVPEEYGGSGMDAVGAVIAHEELSAADPAFTLSYLAHSMLFVNNLAVNGSHEQKLKYLPKACSGEFVCGMGMSEPAVGTDVLNLTTTARANDDGSWTLNGAKMWITNGTVSKDRELGDAFLVYARTAEGPKGISLFLVDKGMPGFEPGAKIEDKLGMRASSTSGLVFEDVVVPADALVGEVNGATLCMMRNLEIERLTLAAMSLGIARRSIEVMNNYSTERMAYGKPLREHGQMKAHLANSYAEYMAGRAYTYEVASRLELDSYGNQLDTDGVKLFAADMAKDVADRAIQVLGGYGYVGEYEVERLYRDARLISIGGGTNEAHQNNMSKVMARIQQFE
ncbi:isovaleryl-CoA dehydrogenase [Thecamonas trahens ATCC 50062]|uniref:Isovaleryl-CoA dehydrogenase n=1 Tax=Thecamonas trahens ATCC 50062 TaxID=461836 RepID=A0A0L0D4H1_THETB|nr:isovaleryl-CoA dehydrogenase [Thecamonas trahens ATCC 50062]KNC46198.1 isovaleryl-CoA dehydrogenase [Thecamonas trahens ATCC 50062]|eukprot:XP_013763173.1 isovaleryl-CoA dehydrogenase [Thecamonas trahens ATCC 50062]